MASVFNTLPIEREEAAEAAADAAAADAAAEVAASKCPLASAKCGELVSVLPSVVAVDSGASTEAMEAWEPHPARENVRRLSSG